MADSHGGDDHAIVTRIAVGDHTALETLYDRYGPRVLAYLLQLTPDRGLAEEILQDTMLAAWAAAGSFEGRSSMTTWLLGITRRQAHNQFRRRGLPLVDPSALDTVPSQEPELEATAIAAATEAELADAVARLAPIHREVLTLAFTYELSYREIAEVIGVPIGTVKSRLSAARRAIRASLKSGEEASQ